MGNICRSPTAEGFFAHHLARSSLAGKVEVDSAGTHSYHLGNPPDARAIREAANHGVDISGLRARKLKADDFERYDLIIAMDQVNLDGIEGVAPTQARAEVRLMMSYDPEAGYAEVPDPYYGEQDDFTLMCGLLDSATRKLVAELERQAR